MDKLKHNVTSLRLNVAKTLNAGVPAVYAVPQGPLRQAIATNVRAAAHTTPQPVFEGIHQQLDDTEGSIHTTLEQLEGTRRDAVKSITTLRAFVSPTAALMVDPDCVERPPLPSSSTSGGPSEAPAVVSTSYHMVASNTARLATANDELTLALAKLCAVVDRRPPESW